MTKSRELLFNKRDSHSAGVELLDYSLCVAEDHDCDASLAQSFGILYRRT